VVHLLQVQDALPEQAGHVGVTAHRAQTPEGGRMKTVQLAEWERDVICKLLAGSIRSLTVVDKSRGESFRRAPIHTERIAKLGALLDKIR
jgi:hypothetical protein